jgi:predicted metal-dependent phosphoesterase TrpH
LPRSVAEPVAAERAFVDLHCHTAASFDSIASPVAVARVAAARGLTHLAITDHGTIDGALKARDAAPEGLTILIGQEVRTTQGDLIGVFLDRAIPGVLTPEDAVAAVREQGGLVGIPHPYDRFRGSMGRGGGLAGLLALAGSVDWIEAWNARIIVGDGNVRAAELAASAHVPGVAVSDAHTTMEVGVASTILTGDPSTPAGLRAALASGIRMEMGRASVYTRFAVPAARILKRVGVR